MSSLSVERLGGPMNMDMSGLLAIKAIAEAEEET